MTQMDLPVKVRSYDTTGSAWKASQRTLFSPWIDSLTLLYVKSLDHSDTNGKPNANHDCATLTYLMAGRGREPNGKC